MLSRRHITGPFHASLIRNQAFSGDLKVGTFFLNWNFKGLADKSSCRVWVWGMKQLRGLDKLIADWQSIGQADGQNKFAELEAELQAIAGAKLNNESNSSLSTGDLINEAFIRLSKIDNIDFQSRAHILALASRIMRQVLIDQARKKRTDKRDHQKVTLVTNLPDWDSNLDLLDINLVLEELRTLDSQRADIIEMRFFGGLTIEDIAVVLDISPATVKRRWTSTRAWLQAKLRDER